MTPLWFYWSGDHMVPLTRFADRARKQYTIGEKYRLVEEHERSQVSHNHFFACLQEAWTQLPEEYAQRFPSVEALRKWSLVRAGFATERSIVADSPEQAIEIGAFVRPSDPYAVITVKSNVVTVYTAMSQSRKNMGHKQFTASKQAVLEIVSQMVGVDVDTLASNAGRAA